MDKRFLKGRIEREIRRIMWGLNDMLAVLNGKIIDDNDILGYKSKLLSL